MAENLVITEKYDAVGVRLSPEQVDSLSEVFEEPTQDVADNYAGKLRSEKCDVDCGLATQIDYVEEGRVLAPRAAFYCRCSGRCSSPELPVEAAKGFEQLANDSVTQVASGNEVSMHLADEAERQAKEIRLNAAAQGQRAKWEILNRFRQQIFG